MTHPITPPSAAAVPDRPEDAPPASIRLPNGSRLSVPEQRTPGDLSIGQWVYADDSKPYRIRDLHKTQTGGRLVLLHGRPPWKVAAGDRPWVYTMQSLPIRGTVNADPEPAPAGAGDE